MAQRHAGVTTTWAEFDRRADGVAATLLAAGVAEQDKVAQYLYNGPEYLESCFAAFKAGLATVNTNFRYAADELFYLWDNADVVAVVFHGVFTERIEDLRHRLPRIRTWLWVDDTTAVPGLGVPYETAAGTTTGSHVAGPWGAGAPHSAAAPAGQGCQGRDVARDDLFGALGGQPQAPAARQDIDTATAGHQARPAQPAGGAADAVRGCSTRSQPDGRAAASSR
jgi:acyl-CoA synthetase (AMP-forming)/AMP-acid ligase II